MSTTLGSVHDCLDSAVSIEVAIGSGGVRLFNSERKVWLDLAGTEKLIRLLTEAQTRLRSKAI